MDTLPLPPSPRLEQYKKRAKALVTAAESADPSAVREWARKWLELVRRFVVDKRTLAPGVPLVAPRWRNLPADPTTHIELALAWACKFARTEVAEFLLDIGVNPVSKDGYDMTALHWAAPNGMIGVVRRLLALGAPLEALNRWEGTVLGSTIHFAIHMPVRGVDYTAMLEMLIAAGANVNAAYPSGNEQIDALLRRHGAGLTGA